MDDQGFEWVAFGLSNQSEEAIAQGVPAFEQSRIDQICMFLVMDQLFNRQGVWRLNETWNGRLDEHEYNYNMKGLHLLFRCWRRQISYQRPSASEAPLIEVSWKAAAEAFGLAKKSTPFATEIQRRMYSQHFLQAEKERALQMWEQGTWITFHKLWMVRFFLNDWLFSLRLNCEVCWVTPFRFLEELVVVSP